MNGKRALWLFVIFFGVQLGVGNLIALILGMSSAGAAIIPLTLVAYLVSGAVVFSIVRRSYPGALHEGALAPIGWISSAPGRIALAALGGLVLAVFYLRFAVVLFPPDESQEFGGLSTAAASATGLSKWLWACMLLVAAPVEEFLFRGALLDGFTRSLGAVTAGVLVTLLFVLGHLPEIRLYYPAILSIALLAGATLAARLWSGSLLPPIGLHAVYNLAIFVDSLG